MKEKDLLIEQLQAEIKEKANAPPSNSQDSQVKELREKLAETRALLSKLRSEGGGDKEERELQVKRIASLEKENASLKKELSAFDLDFFEGELFYCSHLSSSHNLVLYPQKLKS